MWCYAGAGESALDINRVDQPQPLSVYNYTGGFWYQPVATADPPSLMQFINHRRNHVCSLYNRDHMVAWGGVGVNRGQTVPPDVTVLNIRTWTWRRFESVLRM